MGLTLLLTGSIDRAHHLQELLAEAAGGERPGVILLESLAPPTPRPTSPRRRDRPSQSPPAQAEAPAPAAGELLRLAADQVIPTLRRHPDWLGETVLYLAEGHEPELQGLPTATAELLAHRAWGLVYGDWLQEDPQRQEDYRYGLPAFLGRSGFLRAPFQLPVALLRREALLELEELPCRLDDCLGGALASAVSASWLVRRVEVPLARRASDVTPAGRPAEDCARCPGAATCRLARDRFALCGWQGYRPFKISFITTTRCNLDCTYCFTRRHNWDLPWEDVRRLLIQAQDLGADQVAISGGEPSLYRPLDDLFDLARELGMKVIVFSNGWNWPEERLRRFLAYDRLEVAVSLEGTNEDSNDVLRGWHAHAEVIEFIRNIRRIKPEQRIYGISIITPDNIADVEAIARYFLVELALDGIRYDRAVPTGNALDAGIPNADLTREFLQRTEALKAIYPGGRVDSCNFSFSGGCPMLATPEAFEISVFANGSLPPCVFLYDENRLALGATREDLLDVLQLDRMRRAQDRLRVLFSRHQEKLAAKGLFNCVECMETYNELVADGGLDAYLNLSARLPIPGCGVLSLPPPEVTVQSSLHASRPRIVLG